jgi:hypothetical protein
MAETRLPWFPCYPTKLLGALSGMKPDQGYVYWIVCLRIYEIGGPCPDNLDTLVRRTGYNRRRVSDALDACFRVGKLVREAAGIMNPFAAEILADAITLREERKRAGHEGGIRSAEKRQQNQEKVTSKAQAKLKQSPTHLHLHLQEQDSLFTDVNRALDEPKAKPKKPPTPLEIERKDFFDRGKVVLGDGAGGLLQRLLAAKHGNVALARAAVEQASTMDNPRQYIGGILRGIENGKIGNNGEKIGFSGLAARLRRDIAAREDAGASPTESNAGDIFPIRGR